MTETATGVAYDPIPDLAWLLGAAQRQTLGYDAQGGIRTYANRLVEGLGLPELASAAEAYTAICKALEAASATAKGDVITIAPERGPQRRVLVSHVEHHIITLTDLDEEK